MNRNDIENKLKPFTESISSGLFSTMSAIRLHLPLLIEIRELGIPVQVILNISGCSYSQRTFINKFSQLRKEMRNNTSNDSSTLNQNHSIKTSTQQNKEPVQEVVTKNGHQNNSEIDINAWRETFARNIHEKIPDNLIEKLARGFEEINVNLDNWHLFAKKHSIFNTKKLLYIFSSRRMYSFNEE
ncbi:hypothetical protein ETN89_21150 (plasmid) [Photobacterium damselae subsp. damselae]|uniref:hypothetical protein n=1 Tax=Photobacterium damselae TaxID=38293 RepID=UPI0010105140|nr:hypothetical protein [Photobacterium damselae]QAY37721.1 hypothetical protein ETN89_21150 [Photobacterium damselae subsp. damselae]